MTQALCPGRKRIARATPYHLRLQGHSLRTTSQQHLCICPWGPVRLETACSYGNLSSYLDLSSYLATRPPAMASLCSSDLHNRCLYTYTA
jgi:hypothetical protein